MMERNTSMSKDKEFGVTVLVGTEKVFQKMLCHSRDMGNNLRGSVQYVLQARERLERSWDES